ncbi:hypothetical protein [Candidatus Babela massiliensis]|uniref:Uncharacterized protein n=1 Tax=Candidatus Babela massiliensis TaxID=673862 RepID=V6DFL5_9BACT|nr:hypothetical protein [Candidatus Babela massiliensis]CDK30387.1 hypothetical protein BABL1_gene_652 [Candidatus Babela massiliensis]
MLIKIKIKYLLLFLVIFNSLNLKSIENCDEIIKRAELNIPRILNQIKETKLNNYINKVNQFLKERINKVENKIYNQNTILLNLGYLGLFKGDITRLGIFAIDYASEYAMYQKILKEKIEHVIKLIKEDSKRLEQLLEDAEESKSSILTTNSDINIILTPQIVALRKYLNDKHKMIAKNPFKENLASHAMINFIKPYILNSIENKLLVTSDSLEIKSLGLGFLQKLMIQFSLLFCAYKEDKNGNYQGPILSPLSMATILIKYLNPRYLSEKAISTFSNQILKTLNSYFNIGIPNLVFTNSTQILSRLIALALAIKYTDIILNNSWSIHATVNQENLLKIIKEYNQATEENNQNKINQSEEELKKFVIEGHSKTINSKSWIDIKNISKSQIGFLLSLPIVGTFAWKTYKFYKNLIKID